MSDGMMDRVFEAACEAWEVRERTCAEVNELHVRAAEVMERLNAVPAGSPESQRIALEQMGVVIRQNAAQGQQVTAANRNRALLLRMDNATCERFETWARQRYVELFGSLGDGDRPEIHADAEKRKETT